jgi:hypothetical protein
MRVISRYVLPPMFRTHQHVMLVGVRIGQTQDSATGLLEQRSLLRRECSHAAPSADVDCFSVIGTNGRAREGNQNRERI